MNSTLVLQPGAIRDIAPLLLDEHREPWPVPAKVLAETTAHERAMFGVLQGLYGFLTAELVAFLREFIGERTAIEIGAGRGALAKALGIPATDNRQQERPDVKAYYAALRQPTVRYGDHVEALDALAAVKKYQPDIAIGCWVTHRYNPARHELGGNADGVDEEALLDRCPVYVLIGNEKVHAAKTIWQRPHTIHYPPWLFSRAFNGTRDFIAIWER